MKVTLTSPVEGGKPGDERVVSENRGAWLIANGYAIAGESKDQPKAPSPSDVSAAQDQTAASNAPAEETKVATKQAAQKPAKRAASRTGGGTPRRPRP